MPTPLTWPVGIAGDFRGVLDRRTGDFIRFTRTAGGATRAPEERIDRRGGRRAARATRGPTAVEEHELLAADGADHDQEPFLAGRTTPVLFASAVLNFGVAQLLDILLELAPAAAAPPGASTATPARRSTPPFSAFVFKVQAGMDSAHRDRLAFARVCSGRLRARHGRHPRLDRAAVRDEVRPGGVRPRPRDGRRPPTPATSSAWSTPRALRVGDTLYVERAGARSRRSRASRPSTSRSPRAVDPAATSSSAAASSSSTRRASCRCCARTCAATRPRCSPRSGRCSSRSCAHRMESEFNAPVQLEPLGYTMARRTDADGVAALGRGAAASRCSRARDGALLALFPDNWRASRSPATPTSCSSRFPPAAEPTHACVVLREERVGGGRGDHRTQWSAPSPHRQRRAPLSGPARNGTAP